MDISVNMIIGACLRKHRKRLKLTQSEVAAYMGRSQSFVSKVETGERSLSTPEFFAFVMALDGEYVVIVEEIHLNLVRAGYLSD